MRKQLIGLFLILTFLFNVGFGFTGLIGFGAHPQVSAECMVPGDFTNVIGWYDPDLGITLNGSDVSDWADQGSEGNDLTQATAADQPFWNSSNASFNNEATVDFDGTELLEVETLASGDITQPTTVFAVGLFTNTNGKMLDGTTSSERHIVERASADEWRMFAGSIRQGTGGADANAHIFTFAFNTTSSIAYVDGGTAAIPSGDAGSHVLGGLSVGGDQGGSGTLVGSVAHLIVLNENASDANKNTIGGCHDTRYGITYTDI